MPDVPNLAQGAAQARKQQEEATKPPEVLEAVSAFLVVLMPNGEIISTTNIDQAVTVQRDPNGDEVSYACLKVHDELQAQKQAQLNTQHLMMAQQQMAAAMRAQQEAASLGDLKGQTPPAAFRKGG